MGPIDDDDWRAHVAATLHALGITDPTAADAILGEVRDAFAALDEGGDDPAHAVLADDLEAAGLDDPDVREAVVQHVLDTVRDGGPRVQVFDGGGGAARSADPRPSLSLVDDEDDDDDARERSRVRVRVRRAQVPRAPSLAVGHLRLPADPDVWQTVVHAAEPATYRIHCDDGELHLAVDGDLLARLEAGQSTDVQGTVIRVRACGETPARGRYRREG